MSEKRLTGRIARENIRLMQVPRPPQGVIEGFRALGDATGIVSDVMDELGIPCGVVGAHILRPTIPRLMHRRAGAHRAQRAAAHRSARRRAQQGEPHGRVRGAQPCDSRRRARHRRRLRHVEHGRHFGARPASARARSARSCGGRVRDVGHSRSVEYPIWSTELSAVTGKWRLQTIEINGPVQIGGVRVEPGDLVVADETSVCFVPRDRMTDVLALAQEKAEAEDLRCKAIDDGIPVPDISRSTYGEKG
jgi:hypothetical protein